MLCEACANNAMQAQSSTAGPPQGLTANLAKLAGRPQQGPAAAPGLSQGPGNGMGGLPQGPGNGMGGLLQGPGNGLGGQPQVQAGDWGRKLEADGAGGASNAEEFTKQFMQQLAGGQ